VDFEYAYFLVHHRRDAALPEAVCRAGVCWKIEENNEQAKQITRLGQYQVRRWSSWNRHGTCAMLALAFLTVQRAQHPEQQAAPENDAVSDHEVDQDDDQGKSGQTRETSAYR
jgi:SRSO17 transposase